VLNAIAPKVPTLIGGSAYLNPSTNTAMKGLGDFQSPKLQPNDKQGAVGGEWGYTGRNLHFGVREHAMGAIANGLALHGGIIPFTATFLTFSDYMRGSMRLSAIMGARVIFVFTHDSVGVGEDGPTHQPVEQFAALRAIPHLTIIRPGDANEVAVAWQVAMESKGPVVLLFTRQIVPVIDRTQYASADGLRRGAYVLAEPALSGVEGVPNGKPDILLIASGSEVPLIVGAQKRLQEQGIAARIVSMPSWELFEAQPKEYRDAVLPPAVRARLAVEAGVTQGWHKYVGLDGDVIGLNRFGASAPFTVIFEKLGFTVDNVVARAKKLVGK
jgi:transketolase